MFRPDAKAEPINPAALRKAPEQLDEKQRSRLDKLFAAHPNLKTLHEKMHQLRQLMNHKHQTKRKCRGLNNGITEGFHRKMKLIQRRAYGFRNVENFRLPVIAQCS